MVWRAKEGHQKPSATGLGVHFVFQSEESPKPTSSPRPRPSTRAPRKGDVKIVNPSESSSGLDMGTAKPHTPRRGNKIPIPSLPLWKPKPRRTEDLQSTDVSVMDSLMPIPHCRQVFQSDLKDVEAADWRVEGRLLKQDMDEDTEQEGRTWS